MPIRFADKTVIAPLAVLLTAIAGVGGPTGVRVEMVQYPREDHAPLARGYIGFPSQEPWHGFDVRQRLVNFIDGALAK
jgi:hypothetical protein